MRRGGVLAGLIGLALLVSCAPQGQYVWASSVPQSPPAPVDTIPLRLGDTVQVVVKGQPDLSAESKIRADGSLLMPIVGPVPVAGITLGEAAARVREHLARIVLNPEVAVSLTARAPVLVTVVGEVHTPGRFELEPDQGVLTALARAGGLTEFAKRSRIFVLREKPEPLRVRFLYGELERGEVAASFPLREGDIVVAE